MLATVLEIVIVFVGLPLIIVRLLDRTRRARGAGDESGRVLTPDWASVERCLRRPVPQALRDLYCERPLITRRDLSYSDDRMISAFEPLDAQAMLDATRWLGFEAAVIATSDCGDAIYLRAGTSEPDTVYLTHHDGGDTEVFAESVAQMLATLRRSNPP